jgi:phosphatidylinositol glycan class B
MQLFKQKQIVFISLAVRIIQALLTSTFFQPDEYFQALEPAHHLVFGYGHLTWEWLSIHPIRSIIYPGVFVPAYWLVKVLGLEHGQWLVRSFLHALFT